MKSKFLNFSINIIKNKYPEYDDDKLDEIAYGLEAIYLTLTKTIIIFIFAVIFGIFKSVLLLLVFYNVIRTTAFGMHAKKSIHCLIISSILFIGGGIVCKYVDINIYIKLIASLISYICLIKYAPADTYKRPLINAKKRKTYKIVTIITSSIYVILIMLFRNDVISTYLCFGLFEATLMIHPLTYRMFQLPYDNYKNYDVSYS